MSDAMAAGAAGPGEMEALLARVLRPVEPPRKVAERLERRLSAVTEAAAGELSAWAEELSEGEMEALRDPRNWVRPVVALAVGGAATGALVLLELRRRQARAGGLRGRLDAAREAPARVRRALR